MRRLVGLLLHTALVVALQPAQHAPPLQKIGKGKYAHWPIATHTSAAHRITISLAIDASPARVKLKFVDARAGARDDEREQQDVRSRQQPQSSVKKRDSERGRLPAHVYSERVANGRYEPKIGFVLLENRENSSHFLGMQINEEYRGQGLAKVMVAIWAALCLMADVPARGGRIDKPILAHTLQSLGFTSLGGTEVLLTDAKRLRDCLRPSGRSVFLPKFSRSTPGAGGGSVAGEGEAAVTETRTVRVGEPFEAPAEEELQALVREVIERDGGALEVLASQEQLCAVLSGTLPLWRG